MSRVRDCIVAEWLRSLDLVQYTQAFLDNGYDDLEICKQIGHPDLDAIGVERQGHRTRILDAVGTLKEEGGTAVYFTLENPDYQEQKALSPLYSHVALPSPDIEDEDTLKAPSPRHVGSSAKSPSAQGDNEKEEGLVTFSRLQLTGLIRDRLLQEGLDLTEEPYTLKVKR